MKKSTLAIAALLTTLSTAVIMPAAYADDSTGTDATQGTTDATTGTTDTSGGTDAPATSSDDSGS